MNDRGLQAYLALSDAERVHLTNRAARHADSVFIDGQWTRLEDRDTIPLIDPSTQVVLARISLANESDVDRAVSAAQSAWSRYSTTSREDRLGWLEALATAYERRFTEIAHAISVEMGCPIRLSFEAQAEMGLLHIREAIKVLHAFKFEEWHGRTLVRQVPLGVCGMITPWNWPMNQIAAKVVPALSVGCTVVLKPSELSPLSALLFAELCEEAGLPSGAFNLINGLGPVAGAALVSHPDVDCVSFTGSTAAGISISMAAAATIKTVHLELGGKSANVILDDADLDSAVRRGVALCMENSGQSCAAPTRMLVPNHLLDRATAIAGQAANALVVGPSAEAGSDLGPVSGARQFDKIQSMLKTALAEGARAITGGPGKPDGLNAGYFVRPTVLSGITPQMEIFREEVFGPVLCLIGYDTDADAIRIANDSEYGLIGMVCSVDMARARKVADALRVGSARINYPAWDVGAPFGGMKRSGIGRENGVFGFQAFVEPKALLGWSSSDTGDGVVSGQ